MAVRIMWWDWESTSLRASCCIRRFGRARKMASITWGYYMHAYPPGLGSNGYLF